jgi:hypothetical protein
MMKGRLILLIISVLVCLGSLELILRYSGRYNTYTERTHTGGYVSPFEIGYIKTWYRVHSPHEKITYKNSEFSASWITNNEGLNDLDFGMPKKGKRILVIGDSFVEGSGAGSNDSSYPRQLGHIIQDSLSPAEVWNCGVGGSDLFFEYILLRDRLLKYIPDIVIVTINNTDIYETIIRGGFERFGHDGKTHYKENPWFEPAFAHSHIARAIVLDALHYDWSFRQRNQEQRSNDSAKLLLCTAMDSFSVLCADQNIKLFFVFHPMQNEMAITGKYFANAQIAHCIKHHYYYVDARDQFYEMGIDSASAGSIYWQNDGHFNSLGYHYLALSVWNVIADKIKP